MKWHNNKSDTNSAVRAAHEAWASNQLARWYAEQDEMEAKIDRYEDEIERREATEFEDYLRNKQ
jgi:hypothetical protein